jgi:excinuclease UvrABC nuclease subunit
MKQLIYKSIIDRDTGRFLKWINRLKNLSGAYIIRDARSHEVLYVGESHSSRLGGTLKRHFYNWKDTDDRKHFVYNPNRIEVAIRCTPPPSAQTAQDNLIKRLEPRDNRRYPAEEPAF